MKPLRIPKHLESSLHIKVTRDLREALHMMARDLKVPMAEIVSQLVYRELVIWKRKKLKELKALEARLNQSRQS